MLLLATSVAADDPVQVLVYDGFGNPTSLRVSGRVIEDEGIRRADRSRSKWRNLVDNVKRLESDEVEEAPVRIHIAGRSWKRVTDDDGVWRLSLEGIDPPLPVGEHPIQVDLAVMQPAGVRGYGKVYVHGPQTKLGVISDFDDTVVRTGVTSKRAMLKASLLRNAAQLEVVPGASEAYQAAKNAGAQAFFYVSGSPQNLYGRIQEFLRLRDLPAGPVLLKNFGEDETLGQMDYKLGRIERVLALLPQTRFVLVGDSGERDPEIYAEIRRRHPERVLGIVIRTVTEANNAVARFTGMTAVADYADTPRVVADFLRPKR